MTRLRNRHFFLSDLLLLALAAYGSHVLRLESIALGPYWPSFFLFAAIALLVVPLVFWRVGLYARYWRYASVDELLLLTGTVTLAALLVMLVSQAGSRLLLDSYHIPRSIPFIFLLLALVATAGPRLAVRSTMRVSARRAGRRGMRPILIAGAGQAGVMIVRELQHNQQLGLEAVGFIDDDPRKQGMHIHGVPVLGDRHAIPALAMTYQVAQVIIAMPTVPGKEIRELVAICEQAQVETRIIPGIYELLDGTVGVKQLREVHIEDLLRRAPVQTNTAQIAALLQGQRLLVTGGAGSIGSELCRQIAHLQPAQLVLVDWSENGLFYVTHELRQRFPNLSLAPVLADIRDRTHMAQLLQRFRPDIIFHAAAHKHVPLMEQNPCEAILNNVWGTQNLVELAAAHGISRFVMISTDKAVNPTNVMGSAKRCAERLVQQVARESGLPYVAVRFGNVLGSSGSVVPLFKQQIAAGGPITVTHPEVRRFFMTIPEAVQLVMQAATLGQAGDIFVLNMGEPVRIMDLARDLISLSGLRPDEDIEIVITGLRPGEKLFEELFIKGEEYRPTAHEKIFVVQRATLEQDPTLRDKVARLIQAAWARDEAAIRPLLQQVVAEYQPQPFPEERSPLAAAPNSSEGSRAAPLFPRYRESTA